MMRGYFIFRQGQSFLALILLIGGIVSLIGVTFAFLSGAFVDSSFGYQSSAIAEATAISGAEDALLQFPRSGKHHGDHNDHVRFDFY
jgi:hypothetical protein